MTPDLSRRIARAINKLDVDDLPPLLRFDIGPASESANTFDDLPAWIQDLVRKGEAK